MTAWIASLSFISANLRIARNDGLRRCRRPSMESLIAHAYWIAAIPAILFFSLVMLPFYYISKVGPQEASLQSSCASRNVAERRFFRCNQL